MIFFVYAHQGAPYISQYTILQNFVNSTLIHTKYITGALPFHLDGRVLFQRGSRAKRFS